ncbi:Tn3 family transposase [Streptomyces sp. NPDC057545]|uniref:Tn3 family transposase n=1 Tax=Streptomyces sp. NPDC057545 TaxID=3346164 RepID=UPI0036A2A948
MPPAPLRREGKVTRRRPEQQNEQAWCLTVVTNAVICWHTTYMMNGHLSLREHRSGSSRPECSELPITLSRKLQDPRRSPSGPLTP